MLTRRPLSGLTPVRGFRKTLETRGLRLRSNYFHRNPVPVFALSPASPRLLPHMRGLAGVLKGSPLRLGDDGSHAVSWPLNPTRKFYA
jgi:hypothetical protein